jgi:hypothetical protein
MNSWIVSDVLIVVDMASQDLLSQALALSLSLALSQALALSLSLVLSLSLALFGNNPMLRV